MIDYIVAVGLVVVIAAAVRIAISMLALNDQLFEVASKTFFDAAERIMRDPKDLPDGVLDVLDKMNSTLADKRSAAALLTVLREYNSGTSGTDTSPSRKEDLKGLRSEIEPLLTEAGIGWVNALHYRSFLHSILISNELKRMEAKNGALSSRVDRMAPIRVYSHIHHLAA